MNPRLLVVVLLAACHGTFADDAIKISIPDVLRPETRARAFQEFLAAYEPETVGSFGLSKPKGLRVSELRKGSELPRYLVSWPIMTDDWDEVDGFDSASAPPRVIVPQESLRYLIFQSDGSLISKGQPDYVSNGTVADMDGDGEPEIIEIVASSGADIPGLEPVGSPSGAKGEASTSYEFLQVRPNGWNSKPVLAILYNTHPRGRALGNTWGYQLSDLDGDGSWEIQLGPVLVPSGVEPKVTIHWDRVGKAWIGPEWKSGDHVRVIRGASLWEEVERITRDGGLGYSLAPIPAIDEGTEELSRSYDQQDILPDKVSKPYVYRSLSKSSNEELFDFMSKRPRLWDYVQERIREATKTEGFWTLTPPESALAFARKNRPPSSATRHLIGIFNPGNEAAPEEGGLTLSDGPSGCFAPEGGYVHQLHCAREGSYFAYVETSWWGGIAPLHMRRAALDFRKVDLAYEQARHVLQTGWWLSRIRSRQISSDGEQMVGGGSTSDGFASVHLASKDSNFTLGGFRYAGFGWRFAGCDLTDETYSPSAFVNLTVQLLRRELPGKIGTAWESLATPSRWTEEIDAPEPHTAEEIERLKATARELLRLYGDGSLRAGPAYEVVRAAGEMGWKELRPAIERVKTVIPPPAAYENRLAEIDAELARLAKELGPEASPAGYRNRQYRWPTKEEDGAKPNANEPAIPGLLDIADSNSKPESKVPDPVYGKYDALFKSREDLQIEAPQPEKDIAQLRSEIRIAIDRLDEFHDAEAILQRALKDEDSVPFAIPRLAELDPERAIKLLTHCEAAVENGRYAEQFSDARKLIEKQGQGSQPAATNERDAQLAILLNSAAEPHKRAAALSSLVPEDDPKRYADPKIDAALTELLARNDELYSIGLPLAAARRLGPQSWETLRRFARGTTKFRPHLNETLPALTLLAQRNREPWRKEIREMVASELQATWGNLDVILWAIWQLDLRDLTPDLERLATSGPEDYEGNLSSGGTGRMVPVTHRYHRARHILSLWKEEDPLCRAKLLVAFGYANANRFADGPDGSIEHLRDQLCSQRMGLSDEQKKSLVEFADWCAANAPAQLGYQTKAKALALVGKNVREALESP